LSLRYLIAEKAFSKIDIFEQGDNVGGIWNYSGTDYSIRVPIPQTNPRYGFGGNPDPQQLDESITTSSPTEPFGLAFETPLYDNLETNIPHFLMQYSDKAFPADAPLFPSCEMVLRYIEEYAEGVRHLIRFQTQVVDVRLCDGDSAESDKWSVTTRDLQSGKMNVGIYDAVMVANGHYTVPHVPDIKGVKEWNIAYPGAIIHSKAYRNPQSFRDKKVLLVGNSASGVDIGVQIGRECKLLLLSSRSESQFGQTTVNWKEDVPEVLEFLQAETYDRAVRLKDGRIEEGIDAVVFCTGYFFSLPFLESLKPQIVTDGLRVRDTYQHMFYIEHPTLAFPVLNCRIIPFTLAENQCAVIARIWSGRLSLPSKDEMRKWEQDQINQQGGGRKFHVLKFPLDAEMLHMLYEWAQSAKKIKHLENNGTGKMGKFWDKRESWMRSKLPEIKKAYAERGFRRFNIRSAEELGFAYEEKDR